MELFETVKQELNNFINLYNQSLENKNIVCAVSCGVDSTVLLHILESLRNEFKYNIVIAHVNHGKRKQSELEEKYIREYALSNNINIEVLRINHDDLSGVNFQEEARDLRIKFFKDVMDKYNTKYLFLAHHLNDDAETIIMHLMRNSSLDGIYGINKVNKYKDYYFIRSMLDIKKSDIYDYASKNSYKYFEDSSNDTDDYTRNKVRHGLIDNTFDDITASINKYKASIGNIRYEINKQRDDFIKDNVIIDCDKIEIKFNELDKLAYDLRIDSLFEILKSYKYSKANIEEIYNIASSSNNKIVRYKDILIIREYNVLRFKKYEVDNNDFNELVIDGFGKFDIDNKHYIEVTNIENDINFNINVSNKDIMWYNVSMLPLVVRKKTDGDRIKIKDGSRKVNDVLTDLKIPASEREKVMLLLDKNGDIIAILGIRKSYLLNECEDRDLLIKTNYYNNL